MKHRSKEINASRKIALELRQLLLFGHWKPMSPLREVALASELDISRNTLREAFRQLIGEGLLEQKIYRGVIVRSITTDEVRDIYICRKTIELSAILESASSPEMLFEPIFKAVEDARTAEKHRRWRDVGTASLQFHQAIVGLLGSSRLDEFFAILAAQLRLAFSEMQDEASFQRPWVLRDAHIAELLLSGQRTEALEAMSAYLSDSERFVCDALRRKRGPSHL